MSLRAARSALAEANTAVTSRRVYIWTGRVFSDRMLHAAGAQQPPAAPTGVAIDRVPSHAVDTTRARVPTPVTPPPILITPNPVTPPPAATDARRVAVAEDGSVVVTMSNGTQRITRPGACGWTLVFPDGRRSAVSCMEVQPATPPLPDASTAQGVDHILEVGGPANLTHSLVAAANGGDIALIGVLTGFSAELPLVSVLTKHVRLSGFSVGSREHQTAMVRALEANEIRPVTDQTFPLERLTDAFLYQETGRHFGKICVEW